MFAKEQIPPEFLLDYEPEEAFACLELNNGLSDNFDDLQSSPETVTQSIV